MKQVTTPSCSLATGIDMSKLSEQLSALPTGITSGLTSCLQRVSQLVECFFAGRADA